MNLTEQQLAQLRGLPGCESATQENAAQLALNAAVRMQSIAADAANKTISADAEIKALKSRIEAHAGNAIEPLPQAAASAIVAAARIQVRDAVAKGALTPAVSESLFNLLLGSEKSPKIDLLSQSIDGQPLPLAVLSALSGNEKGPEPGAETPPQPVGRVSPGTKESDEQVSPEKLKEYLAMTGLGQSVLVGLSK